MISRWGFDLDMSAVRLMRREGDHWQEVARENIDGPDIEDRLMSMVHLLEEGAKVHLFLPRDQILYTDVKISSEGAATREIEQAMEGRTPYALDELRIDWVLASPGTARVAAIALETLDEAAAFAEARGLEPAGFSSLAVADDFPRMPIFGGDAPMADLQDIEEEPEADTDNSAVAVPVTFTSTREPRQSEILTLKNPTTISDGPVIRVDDATPVMQVQTSSLPPLNPGRPLDQTPSAPRVRTDIAAGTLSSAAATLKPAGPSITMRASPSKSRHTAIVFAVAAIMTIGIAAIVWSILPMTPGRTTDTPTGQTETGLATDTAEAPETLASGTLAPDLPQPDIVTDVFELSNVPDAGHDPQVTAIADPEVGRVASAGPLPVAPDPTLLPQATQPRERRPETLAGLLTDVPTQGLDGTEDTAETTLDIYLASVERRDFVFDAIALPNPSTLGASDLPQIGESAAAPDESDLLASVDPRQVITDETPAPEQTEVATMPPATGNAAELEPAIPPSESDTANLPADQLRPTALAAGLPATEPRPRPAQFEEKIERDTFGGRTRAELARLLPPPRPDVEELIARAEQAANTASELAVATSLTPRSRPRDFDAIIAAAALQSRARDVAASVDFETPDTTAAIEAALAEDAEPEPRPQDTPRLSIPSSASVARQATIENAIPLNKINLVGVYGVPSDRRALVRLPSGRYVKVKVGDRVDGGTVAQINDSELIYRKGSRTVALTMPKG